MMKKLVPAFCVIIMMAFAVPVMAQGADDADYQKRVELARQMHEIRPINMQVEDIVIGLALIILGVLFLSDNFGYLMFS